MAVYTARIIRTMSAREPVYGIRYGASLSDGSRLILSSNAAPLFDKQGEIDSVVVTVEDVTERAHAEKRLREAKQAPEEAKEAAEDRRQEAERRQQIAESLGDILISLNS